MISIVKVWSGIFLDQIITLKSFQQGKNYRKMLQSRWKTYSLFAFLDADSVIYSNGSIEKTDFTLSSATLNDLAWKKTSLFVSGAITPL